MSAPPIIVLQDVHLEVDGRAILAGANLVVQEGDNVVIAGPQDAGKSFVIRLLLGLPGMARDEAHVAGRVVVAGRDLGELSDVERHGLRRRIGSVLRGGGLIENMDIRRNIALPLQYHFRDSLGATEIEARCGALLADLCLERLGDPGIRPVSLTREERLYVSLARALVTEPFLLLLDDPAAGLSPASAHRLCRHAFAYEPRFINSLPGADEGRGLTRLVTAADLRHYLDFGDRFALLHEGQLHEIGDRAAVVGSHDPRVRALLEAPRPLTAAEAVHG